MNLVMGAREQDLCELRSYINRVDKDVTLALQALQWDLRTLREDTTPSKAVKKVSLLRPADYDESDELLPDPPPCTANLVTLSPAEISRIIMTAAQHDPSFKIGDGDPCSRPVAQSASQLLSTYTRDERRALYDAVATRAPAAPAACDLPTLPGDDGNRIKPKSSLELMAELRNMKRRRTKYKLPTGSTNYSQVLREIIKNQMELYTGIKEETDSYSLGQDVSGSSFIHETKAVKQERFSVSRDHGGNRYDKCNKRDRSTASMQSNDHGLGREIETDSSFHKSQTKNPRRGSSRDRNEYDHRCSHSDAKEKCDTRGRHTHRDKYNRRHDNLKESRDHGRCRSRESRADRHHDPRVSKKHKDYDASQSSRDCRSRESHAYRDNKSGVSRDHRGYESGATRTHRDYGSQDDKNRGKRVRERDHKRLAINDIKIEPDE